MKSNDFLHFTKDMKDGFTILCPNMLPLHFKLILSVMRSHGFKIELLETTGPEIAELGLKYTHNDTCYPAILVIGQFLQALRSGKYDLNKTALIMFQTGGGCRASNYISLIRKAIEKAGFGNIPVISFSLNGIESHSGFKLSPKILHSLLYAVLYGDLLMSLVNSTKPYEKEPGETRKLADAWTEKLAGEFHGGWTSYRRVYDNYKRILADFASIPRASRNTVKVGIVGEIYVKYSPLANNNLEDFLIDEGAEVCVPGLFDFLLYPVYNSLMEWKIFRRRLILQPVKRIAYDFLCKKKNDIISLMKNYKHLTPWTAFDHIAKRAGDVISTAVRMGEGWLLPAEMLELADSGCRNIVCAQPFGCLPNHICGKGMMKPIKEIIPDTNIVAIDYDAGASGVNQKNRLKLMLSNAEKSVAAKEPAPV